MSLGTEKSPDWGWPKFMTHVCNMVIVVFKSLSLGVIQPAAKGNKNRDRQWNALIPFIVSLKEDIEFL